MSRKPGKSSKTAPKRKAAAKKPSVRAKQRAKSTAEPKAAKVKGYSKDGLAYAKGLRD